MTADVYGRLMTLLALRKAARPMAERITVPGSGNRGSHTGGESGQEVTPANRSN